MYRAGKRHRSRRKLFIGGAVLVAVLIFVLVTLIGRLLKGDTYLGPPPKPVITTISDTQKTKKIDEPIFSLELPTDWQLVTHTTNPYDQYIWHNTAQYSGQRQLDVFVDTIPANFALNRFLVVGTTGNHLQHLSDISDNCANFTPTSRAGTASGVAPSKWNGVNFLCDVGNYSRNVAGIGTGNGQINSVTLSSPAHGTHRFFITYTDNSPEADYSPLYSAVDSFTLK